MSRRTPGGEVSFGSVEAEEHALSRRTPTMKAKNLTMSLQQPWRKKQGTEKKVVQSRAQVVADAEGA